MKIRIKIIVFLFVLVPLMVNAKITRVQNGTYYITDFGAKGDSSTINTVAIQKAINACFDAGGGKVVVPVGQFITGTIIMKDNVELNIMRNGSLIGSTEHNDYPLQPIPSFRSHKDQLGGFYALIYAEGAKNIAITGYGKIDGRGKLQSSRSNPVADDIDGRPRNVLFVSCKNVTVDGIEFWNSGLWNLHLLDCEDVTLNGIKVNNHANRNNDGIDIDCCQKVMMSNSIIDCDDDGIVLKSTGATPCEDIVITNCIISCFVNAIKTGTESTGGFKNISISNCVIMPSKSKVKPIFNTPRTGVTGISLMIVDGGTLEGININNITIHGTKSPIYIRLANRARKYTAGIATPSVGKVKNISISNIIAYGTGSWGVSITGIKGHPVKNISFNNIQFFSEGGVAQNEYNETVKEDEKSYPMPTEWKNLPAYGIFIRHAENISINQLMLGLNSPDVRVPIMANDVNGLQITNTVLSTPVVDKPFLVGNKLINYKIDKPLGWSSKNGNEIIQIRDVH